MSTMPSLFISHGSPEYALHPGYSGAQLTDLGLALPRPAAILIVSPHWMTRGIRIAVAPNPKMIYDFGGFDPALRQMRYPAHGHLGFAQRAHTLLNDAGFPATLDADYGLDHGAWVPLMHLYPRADVPVFQVSLPVDTDSASAVRLGRALAPLALEGVLIIGSGSLTHNLYEMAINQPTYEYVIEFTEWVRNALLAGDWAAVEKTLERAPHAQRAHPTTEHFLPLLVALGAADLPPLQAQTAATKVTVLEGGYTLSAIAMESYLFGDLSAEADKSGFM
jgi:4,5-DOPA dioxygenase extradiol